MDEHTKAELAAELDRARAKLSRNMAEFRRDIDVPSHLNKAVRQNKTLWLSGAAALGLVIAKLPSRKKKVYVDSKTNKKVKEAEKAGLALALAKLAFSAAKPVIMGIATKKIAEVAKRQGGSERRSYS